jgi:hypothetical protein
MRIERLCAVALAAAASPVAASRYRDPRDIMQAVVMLDDGYTDQPYCAVNDHSSPPEWSCVITGHLARGETGGGQHVMSVVSTTRGKTWEGPFTVEHGVGDGPAGLPNAYGNILLAPELNGGKGRLFTVCTWRSRNQALAPSLMLSAGISSDTPALLCLRA